MKNAEFTALLFLLTQFTIPANATPGWPTPPRSIFHAALLLLHASRDAGATEVVRRNKAAEQAETSGQKRRGKTLQFPLLHLCGLCYCTAKPETFIICFLAKNKQTPELPTTTLDTKRGVSDRQPGLEDCNCPNTMKFCKALTIVLI